jgi:hypothetical protein
MWGGGSPLQEGHKQIRSFETNSINTTQNFLIRDQKWNILTHGSDNGISYINLITLWTFSVT